MKTYDEVTKERDTALAQLASAQRQTAMDSECIERITKHGLDLEAQLADLRTERERYIEDNRSMSDYIRRLPSDWFEDASLETWFPLTAQTLADLRVQLDAANGELRVKSETISGMNTFIDKLPS